MAQVQHYTYLGLITDNTRKLRLPLWDRRFLCIKSVNISANIIIPRKVIQYYRCVGSVESLMKRMEISRKGKGLPTKQ